MEGLGEGRRCGEEGGIRDVGGGPADGGGGAIRPRAADCGLASQGSHYSRHIMLAWFTYLFY